ncbi:hypothetical protein [Streptomyces sp. NPDC090057]
MTEYTVQAGAACSVRARQASVFSMTHHVECVAIPEPAAKGS